MAHQSKKPRTDDDPWTEIGVDETFLVGSVEDNPGLFHRMSDKVLEECLTKVQSCYFYPVVLKPAEGTSLKSALTSDPIAGASSDPIAGASSDPTAGASSDPTAGASSDPTTGCGVSNPKVSPLAFTSIRK